METEQRQDERSQSGEFHLLTDLTGHFSEMAISERKFLDNLIRSHRPAKVLEVGVAAGASSAIMLNAMRDNPDARLYSIDFMTPYYKDNSKKTGFLCQELMGDETKKWTLYTGDLTYKFMDEIGDGIDFCLLDASHSLPGEVLDFLMILPYLAKNAVIVIHDLALFQSLKYITPDASPLVITNAIACRLLYSVLQGEKMMPAKDPEWIMANMGAVRLEDDPAGRILDLFSLLGIPWHNNFEVVNSLQAMRGFVLRHYGEEYATMFSNILAFQQEAKQKNDNEWNYSQKGRFASRQIEHIEKMSLMKVLKSLLFPWYVYKNYRLTKALVRYFAQNGA